MESQSIDMKARILPVLADLRRYSLQIILLYIFIFQPPFISRTAYFIIEVLLFAIFFRLKPSIFLTTFNRFKNEFFLFSLILIYTIFRDLVRLEMVYTFKILSWFFQSFIFSILIVAGFNNRMSKSEGSATNLLSLVYWGAIIGAILSCILLINDSFNEFYNSLIILDPDIRYNIRLYRGYGVSENLTFTYAYVLGIIAGYTLYILNAKGWYILFIPFLIIGVIFNARLGLIPIFIFLFLLLFKRRSIKSILIIIASIILILILLPKLGIYEYIEHNMVWLTTLLSGQTINTLLKDFLVFPNNVIDWIFGSGINLFLPNPGMPYSDIGYITQLNYGGLIFLILLFFLFAYMVIRLIKCYSFGYWFTILFTLSILVMNFKGSAFVSTPGSRFLYLFYVYMISIRYEEKGNTTKK